MAFLPHGRSSAASAFTACRITSRRAAVAALRHPRARLPSRGQGNRHARSPAVPQPHRGVARALTQAAARARPDAPDGNPEVRPIGRGDTGGARRGGRCDHRDGGAPAHGRGVQRGRDCPGLRANGARQTDQSVPAPVTSGSATGAGVVLRAPHRMGRRSRDGSDHIRRLHGPLGRTAWSGPMTATRSCRTYRRASPGLPDDRRARRNRIVHAMFGAPVDRRSGALPRLPAAPACGDVPAGVEKGEANEGGIDRSRVNPNTSCPQSVPVEPSVRIAQRRCSCHATQHRRRRRPDGISVR